MIIYFIDIKKKSELIYCYIYWNITVMWLRMAKSQRDFPFVVNTFRSFSYSWRMTVFVARVRQTTGVTSGAGTAHSSRASEFIPGFSGVRVTRSLVLSVMFCRSLLVLLFFIFLVIVLSVLRFTYSDYPMVSSNCYCWVLSRRHINSTLRQWKEKTTDMFARTDHTLTKLLLFTNCCMLCFTCKNLAFARHKSPISTTRPNGELSLFIHKWFQRYNL